jgi:hypothetical protein
MHGTNMKKFIRIFITINFGSISRPARSVQHYCAQYERHESRRRLNTAKAMFVIPCDQSELQPQTAVLSVNFKSVFQQPWLHCLKLKEKQWLRGFFKPFIWNSVE